MGAKYLFFPILMLLPLCLNCAFPQQPTGRAAEGESKPPKITPPQIIPSIRDVSAPPILGVNYIETIGRPGQGAGQFLRPTGLAFDHRGLLYVADSGNNRIQVVDADGNFVAEFGQRGWRTGEFENPGDVAINFQRTELLYVADTDNNRIQYCNLVDRIFHVMAGSQPDRGGESGDATEAIDLEMPGGMAIGRNGEIYVVDTGNNRFVKFSTEGLPVLARGSFGRGREQFRRPTDLVVDARGNLYITDSDNHRIQKYDFSGNFIQMWGSQGSVPGQFQEPGHIVLDRWNYLYVTDRGNHRVQIFTETGQPVAAFSGEGLVDPVGIAISKGNRIFVSDLVANDIKVFQVVYRP